MNEQDQNGTDNRILGMQRLNKSIRELEKEIEEANLKRKKEARAARRSRIWGSIRSTSPI